MNDEELVEVIARVVAEYEPDYDEKVAIDVLAALRGAGFEVYPPLTPRGFTRCDECEGEGRVYEHSTTVWGMCPGSGCPSCSGSGLVPTEKLREEDRGCPADHWEPGLGPCICAGRVHSSPEVAEHLGGGE